MLHLHPGGLVETIKYPNVEGETGRETVTYIYDDAGRPYSLVGTRGSNTWRYVEAAGYNAWGAPEMWDLGDIDDLNRNWLYDDTTRRVSQIRGGTSRLGPGYQVNVMRHRYEGYDLSGNVTVLRDSRNSDQYQCFTYDTMDRLTGAYTASACDGDPDQTGEGWFNHSEFEGGDGYDYDTIGNITDLSGIAYTYAQSGNAGPHAPTGVGSVVFAYDPNGNRLKATDGSDVTTYSYGADNRLEDITLPGGDILEYWYDADGQRVRRRHKGSPNYNTHYIGALVEVDTEGSTPTETRTHYSFGGLPVALRTHEADEVIFVFTDHLGSVTSTWNDTTNTLTLTRYFPYGGERHSSGEMPQDQRYTGQVSDATANASGGSGLLYYNARYYDPTTAQFTQPDTIVPDPTNPTDLNRYSYVRGNPVRFVDPSGHCTEEAYGIPCEDDAPEDEEGVGTESPDPTTSGLLAPPSTGTGVGAWLTLLLVLGAAFDRPPEASPAYKLMEKIAQAGQDLDDFYDSDIVMHLYRVSCADPAITLCANGPYWATENPVGLEWGRPGFYWSKAGIEARHRAEVLYEGDFYLSDFTLSIAPPARDRDVGPGNEGGLLEAIVPGGCSTAIDGCTESSVRGIFRVLDGNGVLREPG